MNPVNPIFFTANRVWRSYTGGQLLREFTGKASAADDHFPEDWLASTTGSANEQGLGEGLSHICSDDLVNVAGPTLLDELDSRAETILSPAHIAEFGPSLGMTCKLIDPAERLPIRCCPASLRSRELYGAEVEGAKAWHVINTREIAGQLPYILVGFKETAAPDAFAKAVQQQDNSAMESMLHKIPVSKGETYFIPAGMPHALGPGVLAFETLSHEGYTVTAERHCGDHELTDAEMWEPLTAEQGLSVFDCSGQSVEETLARTRVKEHVLLRSDEGMHAELIGSERTSGFSLWRVEVVGRLQIKLPRPIGLVLCTAGEGRINWADGTRSFKAGEYFLQPYTVPWVEYAALGRLALIIALPPMA